MFVNRTLKGLICVIKSTLRKQVQYVDIHQVSTNVSL